MSDLENEIAIENARVTLRNAREWLDYMRGTGDWKPLTFWQGWGCIRFPPRRPTPGEVESAERLLKEKDAAG